VNGRTVFDGKVEKNVRTLLKYAASDNDRTMLFGVELHIKNAEHDNALSHVHIDFFNPTNEAEAVIHIIKDLKQWDTVHTNQEVIDRVKAQGIEVESSPD